MWSFQKINEIYNSFVEKVIETLFNDFVKHTKRIKNLKKNNTIKDEFLNFYFFNEFSVSNFLNFKNIIINYNFNTVNFFNFSSLCNINRYFKIEVNGEDTLLESLNSDFLNLTKNLVFAYTTKINGAHSENSYANFYWVCAYKKLFSYCNLPANFSKYSLTTYNTWFFFTIMMFLISFIMCFCYFIMSNKLSKLFNSEKLYDDFNAVTNYFVESEKELGSLDDLFFGVSILICIYGWFFYGTIFFNFFYNVSYSYLYLGFPFFLLVVLGMPFNMIFSYGLLFSVFLRGSSNTSIMFLEFMYDILATNIMFIRLIVQNVRFILMFFAFFECYEFFLNTAFITKNFYYFTLNETNTNFFFINFVNMLNFFIFYTYNICHLIYTIISHFFAYLILVFWFFSFLYTTFFKKKLEKYFDKKRK